MPILNYIYEFERENFDFKKRGSLKISYEQNAFYQNTHIIENGHSLNRYISDVTCSSRLGDKYSVENLFDRDFSTAWVEGSDGFGKGDYVEITFKDNAHILPMLFVLVPGYTKSEKLYKANNRIKEICLEIGYHDPESDEMKKLSKTVTYQDESFRPELPGKLPLGSYGFEFGNIGSNTFKATEIVKGIKSLKIIIQDVYKGEKYDDSCISEIFFVPYARG